MNQADDGIALCAPPGGQNIEALRAVIEIFLRDEVLRKPWHKTSGHKKSPEGLSF